MPQLHWSTWRGELQESPAGFGLAHRTRNAHMVRELTAVSNFPGRAEMGTLKTWGYFPQQVGSISCGFLAGSRNHQALRRVMCARSKWIVNFETSDLWSNHVLIFGHELYSLDVVTALFLRGDDRFLLCNRPAVQVASSGSEIDTRSFLYYIDRFEMRKQIDEKDENRCFFFQKMHKESERTLLFLLLFFCRPSWDPRWREAQDFAWGSWACNTSCMGVWKGVKCENEGYGNVRQMVLKLNFAGMLLLAVLQGWCHRLQNGCHDVMMSEAQRLRAPRCEFAAPDRLLKLSSDEVFTISPIWGQFLVKSESSLNSHFELQL